MIVTAKMDRSMSWKMRTALLLFAIIVAPLSLHVARGETAAESGPVQRRPASREFQSQVKTDVASDEADKVFRTALRAIADNYEHLRSVSVTFEELNVDPSVKRRETVSGENEKGVRWSMTVAPVFISRSVVSLEGNNLRAESFHRVGNDWDHVSTRVRKDDIWTTFHRSSHWVQRKVTEDLGSFFPVDPRDFGGLDQRYGLLDQMRRSEALSVTWKDGMAHVTAEIVDRPKYGYEPKQRFTYSFDTRRNYLPTRVIRHYGDGSINVLSELAYEEVVPGKSWFVREITVKFFRDEVGAKSPDSDGWHQFLMHRAVGPIRVNEELDDEFTVDVPPGVRITDQTGRD